MFNRHRIDEFSDVVDYEMTRKPPELRLVLRQITAIQLDVRVPAERMDRGHDLIHEVETDCPSPQCKEALRTNARRAKPLDLGLGDTGLYHRDTSSAGTQFRDCGQRHTIVVLVRVRLHHDHPLQTQPLLQLPVHRHRGVARQRRSAWCGRYRAVVEVHVGVATAGWCRNLWNVGHRFFFFIFGNARVGSPPISANTKLPPWKVSARGSAPGFSFASTALA